MHHLSFIVGVALASLAWPAWPAPAKARKADAASAALSANEFAQLNAEISAHRALPAERRALLARQARQPAGMVQETDRDALDLVLRRIGLLLEDLGRNPRTASLAREAAELAQLKSRSDRLAPEATAARQALFSQACQLRRRVAFANPLLDFDRLAFLTHHRAQFEHMCDQYYGFHARPGGSVFMLEKPFSDQPVGVDLLARAVVANGPRAGKKLEGGSFLSLELDWEARRLLFAWTPAARTVDRWTPDSTYHLFQLDLASGGLQQLTDGAWNDFDPCVLPDGRVVFVSERRGGYLRCGGPRLNPTYTLHVMNADGSDLRPLSRHETHEWHPSVDHQGMLVFTRWDYVDRDSDIAHHLWTCYPDGRDPRSSHGNYPVRRESRPWMEMSIRAIPDSHRFVAVAAPHHGQAYGSLVLIDPRLPDDGAMSQLRRITPETAFPEAEAPYRESQIYGTPWPLSEDYHLCVYDPGATHYGLYLVDSFGNRELLWRDPAVACLDPIPLRPRPRPPVVASSSLAANAAPAAPAPPAPPDARPPVDQRPTARADVHPPPPPAKTAPAEATVAIMNIYDSEFAWPEKTKIAAVRVIQIFPKTTVDANRPNIGAGNQSLARGVLGVAPVEADGSAHFIVPAQVPVYFQALDEQGRAVQSMRSATWLAAGETLACRGCHESKTQAAPARRQPPLALRRAPSPLAPEPEGAYPLSFPRLVQGVLDRHCVECHQREPKAKKLDATPVGPHGWSVAYQTLWPHAYYLHGGNGWISKTPGGGSRSVAGQVGARGSKLLARLQSGPCRVELPPDDLRRLIVWLDGNSNFYGAYHDLEAQARGELVLPLLE